MKTKILCSLTETVLVAWASLAYLCTEFRKQTPHTLVPMLDEPILDVRGVFVIVSVVLVIMVSVMLWFAGHPRREVDGVPQDPPPEWWAFEVRR